ncbi:hypothetical protein HJB78_24080 [Rhizobium lentis]|uniref:DpnII family type II restriction endonuclease n=1 Tax=Rhizobium lentis TaxID=1138194 RepID=UPI001C83975C|nr:DpnII family type II restriction endonuclease [Rhizobium lentis]MBX5154023.1 hypothetical protein [Rhizobium lentis]
MRVVVQDLDAIVASLSPLDVNWMDDIAASAIARLKTIPQKATYTSADIQELLDGDFEEGILCARLFLALSKDAMTERLRSILGAGGIGSTRYSSDKTIFINAFEELGLLEAFEATINYQPVWSDILAERLRSGRGSAIQGQKRGRGLEDFAEKLVQQVFGDGGYETRCTFIGADGATAKCDIAIPDKSQPRIVLESKGYGATGSKMTDIIGDLDAIIAAKRHDCPFLFVTDGLTWKSRLSDLRKIVHRQNQGKIAKIYTMEMGDQLLEDLATLKAELAI